MKKYDIEIKINNGDWDSDAIQDYVEAENKDEAIELAKDYLVECAIQNDQVESVEEIKNKWEYKATEK